MRSPAASVEVLIDVEPELEALEDELDEDEEDELELCDPLELDEDDDVMVSAHGQLAHLTTTAEGTHGQRSPRTSGHTS